MNPLSPMLRNFTVLSGLGICGISSGAILCFLFPTAAMFAMFLLLTAFATFTIYNDLKRSRNISTERQSQLTFQQQQREHRLLLESVHNYPMPYVIYDEEDLLSVWNKPFEKLYSCAFDKLEDSQQAKGMSYEEIQYANIEDGLLTSEKRASICHLIDRQKQHRISLNESENEGLVVDRHYADIGWFRISKYSTPSGGMAAFAIDINELKERESDLIKEVNHRKELEIEIRKIAYTDELTGIPNRRHFMERAEFKFDQTVASNGTIAVLMIDIDHFKNVNDTYGHACGDEVITATAKVVSTSLSSYKGICGRLGGEEFGLIHFDSSVAQSEKLAHTIRSTLAEISFRYDNHSFSVTVSIGVAVCDDAESTLTHLLKLADDALYASKRAGRNCVTISNPGETEEYRKTG